MSLYRETSGRSARAVAFVALGAAAVLAVGFAFGRATAPAPSLAKQLARLQEDARPAADALELVALHYGASNETTREAASAQLDRARESFEAIEDELALVNPEQARDARDAIEEVSSLVAAGAPAEEVERAAAEAEAAVRAAAGTDPA